MTNLNVIRQNLAQANLTIPEFLPLSKRKGKLPCTLQNDYLFKSVLQIDESALRSLLCSLLHLKPKDISSVSIENPIIIGSYFKNKTVILDIKALLNNNRIINLEMQRSDEGDWQERSLIYLCKMFNSLKSGESYADVFAAEHIGILDFSSQRLSKEFYSHYYIMNSKTYEIYSDKLCLSVLNLSYMQLATEEDKYYRLDQWAALFKADTWEDIQMLTDKNPAFESIADAVYFLTENRELIDAYQDYEARQAYYRKRENLILEKDRALLEKDYALQEKDTLLAEKDASLAEKNTLLAEKDAYIAELKKANSAKHHTNFFKVFANWKNLFRKH